MVRALNGGWHYPTGQDGKVTRDKPKKPNHPHEDYGDALCYLIAGMAPLAEEQKPVAVGRAIVAATAWDHYGVAQAGTGKNAWGD